VSAAKENFGADLTEFQDLIPEYANSNNTNHGDCEKLLEKGNSIQIHKSTLGNNKLPISDQTKAEQLSLYHKPTAENTKFDSRICRK